MEAEKMRNEVREKEIMVEKKGDAVRAMKAEKFPQEDIEKVVNDLKNLKLKLGVASLYDYGPLDCAIKANAISYWRQARYKLS
ncbi:hypothetical protein SUGI_1036560 [Cryptomeria japonica]|nr:hypothetical protein SUGI_1036560 [Cryptomeria japonica]